MLLSFFHKQAKEDLKTGNEHEFEMWKSCGKEWGHKKFQKNRLVNSALKSTAEKGAKSVLKYRKHKSFDFWE